MNRLTSFVLFLIIWLSFPSLSLAVSDPLAVPNNRVGVHILDPQELRSAAKLVNSNGGDWGYVTIPIRSDDRDQAKWKEFFTAAKELHVIPIIRLATYVDGDHWVRPTAYDLVAFANFLNELPWPVKNRYIIVFNEPNHSKEWGQTVNPGEYAALLVQAKEIFSARSSDFFIITAGLDMSAPQNHTSWDALRFYREMFRLVPNWYRAVDGVAFHSYPNPGFISSVNSTSRFGPKSYTYELSELKKYGFSPKSIFITETGSLSTQPFFTPAFRSVWDQNNIVAITPFLLFAGSQDFAGFSLLNLSHEPTPKYLEILTLAKTRGSPLLAEWQPLPSTPTAGQPATTGSPSIFSQFWQRLKSVFTHPQPRLNLGSTQITVEIVDTPASRAQGLSGRSPLPANHGMLFVFPSVGPLQFWMKDMKFALDMIWIRDGQIVEITPDVPPPAQTNGIPQVVTPTQSANWVLEVPAGFAASHNIQVGSAVELIR